jgi:hypothetical protein
MIGGGGGEYGTILYNMVQYGIIIVQYAIVLY